MEENSSPSDSDYLSSSIGSRFGSIERPGIWVWLADHLNKRRSSKRDLTEISSPKEPETIGRSLFYLSSSWNPIDLETDLKQDDQSPVESLTKWPSSIDPKSLSNGNVIDGHDEVEPNTEILVDGVDHLYVNTDEMNDDVINREESGSSDEETSNLSEATIKASSVTSETTTSPIKEIIDAYTPPFKLNEESMGIAIPPSRPGSRPASQPVSTNRFSSNSKHSSTSSDQAISAAIAAAVEHERERYEMRRNRLLQELLTTEEDYVHHLASVINGYMSLMNKDKPYPIPDDLKGGKTRIVFGNIESIYEWHRDYMLKEIRKCVSNRGPLGPVFKRWLKKLNIYVIYCQNKNKSEFIVQQYLNTYFEDLRLHLGHQLRLPDLLIKPIQRIMKYQLILSNLLKYTQQAGLASELNDLRSALEYMQAVPKTTNDMMALTRLAGYEGSIMTQGNLIMQGILFVGQTSFSSVTPDHNQHISPTSSYSSTTSSSSTSSFYPQMDSLSPSNLITNSSSSSSSPSSFNNKGYNNLLTTKLLRSMSSGTTYGSGNNQLSPNNYHLKKRYIFLFEKLILVCKVPARHHAFLEYIYKFHLPMNKITSCEMMTSLLDENRFRLTIENYAFTGSNEGSQIVMKTLNPMETEKWFTSIQKILDRQLYFIKALISPITHQKSLETSSSHSDSESKSSSSTIKSTNSQLDV